MRKLTLLVGCLLLSTGCLVVRPHGLHHGRHRAALRAAPRCHPSHFWDGDKCRHKGKGHGARKHDH